MGFGNTAPPPKRDEHFLNSAVSSLYSVRACPRPHGGLATLSRAVRVPLWWRPLPALADAVGVCPSGPGVPVSQLGGKRTFHVNEVPFPQGTRAPRGALWPLRSVALWASWSP